MYEMMSDAMTRRRFLAAGAGITLSGTAAELFAAPAGAHQGAAQMPPPVDLPLIEAATEVQPAHPPTALPPDRRVGFAVVGLGHLALEQILPAFGEAKRCKPVALVSGDAAKAAQVARQYGIDQKSVYDYGSYDRLRDNSAVEVIYIVLPNGMHAEYTVRGAQAGKHILCEKPMATSVQEAEQMIAACRKADRKLMIAYRIQYEPHHRAAMKMTRGREIGVVKQIGAHNGQAQGGDLNQWRLKRALAGGGSLPDVGLYCLNTTRFLTGEEPIEITATSYTTPNDPRFKEVEEGVSWIMRFPSGIMAACSCSYGYHEARRYRVFGSDAWIDVDPAFSYSNLNMKVGRKSTYDSTVEQVADWRMDPKNQFALEMDHMAECVQQNKTPYTPGEEGLQDHRLMDAIYEAARSGRSVRLPVVSGLDTTRGSAPGQQS